MKRPSLRNCMENYKTFQQSRSKYYNFNYYGFKLIFCYCNCFDRENFTSRFGSFLGYYVDVSLMFSASFITECSSSITKNCKYV